MPSATPDPSSRICKKLVLKGHATQRGASYTLFIKAELPHNPKAQTYSLLPEKNVRLKDAVVHPLDLAGAAPALSGSAARAASYLGIPLSINHDLSTSLLGSDGRTTPSSRRRSIGSARRPSDSFSSSSVPRVTVSNFNINLVAPPLFGLDSSSNVAETSRGPSTPSRKNVAGFIIILQLEVGLASTPPRGPYMVRFHTFPTAMTSCAASDLFFKPWVDSHAETFLPEQLLKVSNHHRGPRAVAFVGRKY